MIRRLRPLPGTCRRLEATEERLSVRLIQKSHRHQNTRRLRSWHHLRPGAGCGKSSHGLVFSVAWLGAQWDNTMRTRASFPTHTGILPAVLRLGTLGPSLTLRVVRRDVSSVEAPIRGLCELAVDLCLDKLIIRTPSWISVLFLTQCRARGNEPLHPKVPNIFGKELLKTKCSHVGRGLRQKRRCLSASGARREELQKQGKVAAPPAKFTHGAMLRGTQETPSFCWAACMNRCSAQLSGLQAAFSLAEAATHFDA